MKTDTYFVKQNIRTRAWVRLDRVSGRTLTLVLALTGTTSVPAGAFDTNSPQTVTPQTQLVSVNRTVTNGGNAGSYVGSISADGRFVVFSSDANDLVANDTNRSTSDDQFGQRDVFVRDLQTGTTTLVSVNRSGTNSGNAPSQGWVLSADGRFVVFQSESTDLVATPTSGSRNVFVRDLQTGTTTLVSVNHAGTNGGNALSQGGVLSANGRFIAFASYASDLVANDTNGTSDVFVRDLQTGVTTLVSVNQTGTDSGNGISIEGLTISANGRFVGFVSDASDLVANDSNGTADVFVRDLQTGTTTLVSVNRAGTDSGNAFSGGVEAPSLSADGRFVAFRSTASDLVPNDTNGHTDDVFVRDLQAGTTTLLSVNRTGTGSGNSFSDDARISADGRFLAFRSNASNLVSNDTNGVTDVFVRDLHTGTTRLVSINQGGTGSGNGFSREGIVSPNGRFVAFLSIASDLVANDTNGIGDVFVRDLHTGTTTLVSVNQAGTNSGNGGSGLLASGIYGFDMSTNGSIIAFTSEASDLVTRDTNGVIDVFVAKITNASIVNDLVTFEPLAATYRTTADPTGCPSGFVGTFGFDAQLTTQPNSPPLSDLAVKVKTLSNGNLLHNADGGNGGVGSMLTVPKQSGYAGGTLSPGESVEVHFSICLKDKKSFTFVVDIIGMH